MDWNLSSGTADRGDAFASPSETGKSTGGGLFGDDDVAARSTSVSFGPEVGIGKFNVGKGLGQQFCGGVIGVGGNKMCVRSGCTTTSHGDRKASFPSLLDDEMVFIYTSSKEDSVHVEPRIPLSVLGDGRLVNRYLMDRRSLDSWTTLFNGLLAHSPQPDEVVRKFIRRVDDEARTKGSQTPMKKRSKLEITSPALEAGYEVTIPELSTSLPDDNKEMLTTLRMEWRTLADSLRTFKEMIAGCREMSKKLVEGTQAEFEQIDFAVARLANQIGTRDGDMDTGSIFKSIKSLGEELASAKSQWVATQDHLQDYIDNGISRKEEFIQGALEKTLESFAPFIDWFSEHSDDKATPGNLLTARLKRIENSIKTIEGKAGLSSGPGLSTSSGPARGVQWGISNMGLNSGLTPAATGPNTGATGLTGASAAVLNDLQDRVKTLEDQMEDRRVEIGTVVFKSQGDTMAWLLANASRPGAHVHFMDAHSLMNLSSSNSGNIDSSEILSFQSSAAKSGYSTSEEALISTSFKIELPSFFGKDATSNMASCDTRVLPAIKAYGDWDPEDGYNGARHRFAKMVDETKKTMMRGATNVLSGMALLVALESITTSSNFLESLGNWITSQQRDLTGRGGSKEHSWMLISHCVRAIFADLHEARIAGRGSYPKGIEAAAGIVWGSLQGLKRMQEYSALGFSAHPKLSHILNLHLQDHALMKHFFFEYVEQTNKKWKENATALLKIGNELDKVVSKVNNKK
jgi:hypothetical protein